MWGKRVTITILLGIFVVIGLILTGCQLFPKKELSGLVLYSPSDHAVAIQLPVALTWSACEGEAPIKYTVYLGVDPNPVTPLPAGQDISNTNVQVAGLQAGVTYYWKVKAQNNQSEITSEIRQFTVGGNAPTAPQLSFPVNGSQLQSEEVLLQWTASAGSAPVSYDVFFGSAPDSISLAGQNLSTTTFLRSFLTSGTYYWRVVSKNAFGEAQSSTFSFLVSVTVLQPPTPPTLLNPTNEAVVFTQPITLQWAASSGEVPIMYDVYADTFDNPVTIVATDMAVSSLALTVLPTGNYHWKVLAKNLVGQAFSETWSFNISADQPATITAPVPFLPQEGAVIIQNTALLQWSASAGATPITYDVYFDQNPYPVTLLEEDQEGTDCQVSGLSDGVYYWRVVGKNASGIAESRTASFTVAVPISTLAVYLEKIDEESFRICSTLPFSLSAGVSLNFSTEIPLETDQFFPRGTIEGLVPNPIVPSPNVGSSVEVIYNNVSGYLNGNALSLSSQDLILATVTFAAPTQGVVRLVSFKNGAETVTIGATDTVSFLGAVSPGVYLEALPGGSGFLIKTVEPFSIGATVSLKVTSTLTPNLTSLEFLPNGIIAQAVYNPIISLPDIVYSNQVADLNGQILYTDENDRVIAEVIFSSPKSGSLLLTEFFNSGEMIPISSMNSVLNY